MIDFDRAVPVFVHDRRVGKAEAFARAQIKILQHQLRRGSEASYVRPAGHQHRIFDNWSIQRVTNDRGTETLFEHERVADVIVMEMGDEEVFQIVFFAIQLLDQKLAHSIVVFRKGPIPAVDEQIFAFASDQVNAALNVTVEFVLCERAVDSGNTPTIRCLGPKEDHLTPLMRRAAILFSLQHVSAYKKS
jgi:hypothetical protein